MEDAGSAIRDDAKGEKERELAQSSWHRHNTLPSDIVTSPVRLPIRERHDSLQGEKNKNQVRKEGSISEPAVPGGLDNPNASNATAKRKRTWNRQKRLACLLRRVTSADAGNQKQSSNRVDALVRAGLIAYGSAVGRTFLTEKEALELILERHNFRKSDAATPVSTVAEMQKFMRYLKGRDGKPRSSSEEPHEDIRNIRRKRSTVTLHSYGSSTRLKPRQILNPASTAGVTGKSGQRGSMNRSMRHFLLSANDPERFKTKSPLSEGDSKCST